MLKEKLKTNNKTNTNAVWGHGNSVDQKKSANEPIANAVGVAPQGDPHFEEPTLKTSKAHSNLISNIQPLTSKAGITLIALIITIIVMLILVGVTISVALNGGLFKKAESAVTLTQKEVDRETLLSAVLASLNNNFEIPKLDELTSNLSNGWNAEGTDGGPYTCTSPKGNIFTVDIKGNITEQSEEQSSENNKLNSLVQMGKTYTTYNAKVEFITDTKIKLTIGDSPIDCEIGNIIIFSDRVTIPSVPNDVSRFFEEYAGKTDIEIAGLVSIDQIGQVALVTKDKKAFFSLENTKFQGIEDQDEIISIISSLSPEEFLGVAVLDKE